MKNDFYVYILFRETGIPFYVGKGQGRRWLAHERHARNGTGRGNPHKDNIIKNVLQKLSDVPKIKIAENLNQKEAFILEELFIKTIGREPLGPLVNLTDGGEGAISEALYSAESRAKISQKLKGVPKSEQARINMSNAKKGKPINAACAEAIRLSLIARTGKPISDEHKAKISAAHKGRKLSPEHVEKLRGKIRTPEQCKRISEGCKNKPPISEETRAKLKARKVSDETKLRMSRAQKGKKRSEAARANHRAGWVIRKAKKKGLIDAS